MIKVNIIIPAEDAIVIRDYYRNILEFPEEDGEFFLPTNDFSVALKVMRITEESERLYPPQRIFPIFSYNIKNNFSSYCAVLYKKKAIFSKITKENGSYIVRLCDPVGNMFEVVSGNIGSDEDIEMKKLSDLIGC